MKSAICIVGISLYMSLVTSVRIDQNDIPPADQYERTRDHYLGKFTLNSLIRGISARECGERCDTQEPCMGFNFYRSIQGKCELLTHNKYTTPVIRRTYTQMEDVDHYVRTAAEYQCPEGSFKHPFKPRCYIVFNSLKNYYKAAKHCRNVYYGELAVIPNEMQYNALWDQLQRRFDTMCQVLTQIEHLLKIQFVNIKPFKIRRLTGPAWIGMQFKRSEAYVTRHGQLSPLLWTANLNRGLPSNIKRIFGGEILESGKFDYEITAEKKGYICEIRSHSDQELNELCPFDTTLFDNNCYWSGNVSLPFEASDNVCAERGGRLAAFPSQNDIEFVGQIWDDIILSGEAEVWIGIMYNDESQVWTWADGDDDKHPQFWNSTAENNEGPTQSCATAVVSGQSISWFSQPCEQQRDFLCMSLIGTTYSRECTGEDPLQCPPHSECAEGFLRATCQCLPGFIPTYNWGILSCVDGTVCQASGDPHYSIFDGGIIHYQGRCRHLLAGSCPGQAPEGFPSWKVIVFNDNTAGYDSEVTFTKYADIEIYNQVIRLGPEYNVMVDGVVRTPEFSLYANDGEYVTVTQLPSPHGTQLITDFGLSVTFRDHKVTVKVPVDYANVMCGICGNFNGVAAEDLKHNQHKWMDEADAVNADCASDDPYKEPTCDADLEVYALDRCGLIQSLTLLNSCRQAPGMEMLGYYNDCMEDSCAMTGSIESDVDDILCDTMDSLDVICANLGHPIPSLYRLDTNCLLECEPHSHYEPEMSLDVATCQNPDAIYQLPHGTGEGCACDEGYIRDAEHCVPTADCGCLDEDDVYMELGSVSVNPTCTIRSRCIGDNIINTSPMECVENAECVLNITGKYGCECTAGYEGDGEEECNVDSCPYPMPDSEPTPDAASLDTALPVDAIPLSVNDVVIDPNRLTSILLMDPESSLLNPFCQIVTCHAGDDFDVSDTTCVDNAICIEGGLQGFQCVCETGYTGNATEECIEDDSSTGDPHFLVTSHRSGQHLCYDAHGYNKEVWRLLSDAENGLIVNGELFETNRSTAEHPQSFFAKIAVVSYNTEIIFTQSGIEYNSTTHFDWHDKINIGPLRYSGYNVYEVEIKTSIRLRVTKNEGKLIGEYLGVFFVKSEGLSSDTTGIIGQFLNLGFEASDVATDDNGYTRSTMIFEDEHPSVPVVLSSRYNSIHRGVIECWLYRAGYQNDQLLGSLDTYDVPHITSQ